MKHENIEFTEKELEGIYQKAKTFVNIKGQAMLWTETYKDLMKAANTLKMLKRQTIVDKVYFKICPNGCNGIDEACSECPK